MRLKPEIRTFILHTTREMFPGVRVYLFGSRVQNSCKGGDIDLLLLSDEKVDRSKIRRFRIEFFKKFGWQKLDVVNFTEREDTTFKRLILNSAQSL